MHLTSRNVTKKHVVLVGVATFLVILASLHLTDTVRIESIPKPDPKAWYTSATSLLQQKQFCKWEFSHYEPSDYEEKWFSIIHDAQNHICDVIQEPEHAANSMSIVRFIESLQELDSRIKWTHYDTVPPVQADPDYQLFSRMHYSRTCYDSRSDTFKPATGRGVQLIEPLWGMLRDPFDVYCGSQRLTMPTWNSQDMSQSKEAIMPQGFAPYTYDLHATTPISKADDDKHSWRPHGIPPWHSSLTPSQDPHEGTVFEKPKNIFVDLGSSYFGGWGGVSTGGVSAVAASGKYFYNTYHTRGQPFNDYIAVELAELDATIAYSQIPEDLVGVYNLINTGLSMEEGNKLNVIAMLKRIVKPNDFFLLKLDIDTPFLEMAIVQNLLDDDPTQGGASALVDELMFEHHVNYEPMMGGAWGYDQGEDAGDLAYSYTVFRELRRKSIRAHSWP
ncbi:hypothetical protein N0V82_007089 [Gnomoniopsis sp. IMI 355080]|nr:hypothetical protein N0V82_007089 [Gnomoniopsis sp. IMI 355080]